jgi:hypothetical protein
MANFSIRVKPEVVQERVTAAQTRDIDRLAAQFKLDKGQILGDGVDLNEAEHLPFDAFMQLSGNDTKITKADLLKFAGTETEEDVIREYARNIAASLRPKLPTPPPVPTANRSEPSWNLKLKNAVKKSSFRPSARCPHQGTEATAAGVFSIINGRDANHDGKIALGGELMGSAFVNTAGDALKLAQGDSFVTPTEGPPSHFEKAQKFAPADVSISYNAQ